MFFSIVDRQKNSTWIPASDDVVLLLTRLCQEVVIHGSHTLLSYHLWNCLDPEKRRFILSRKHQMQYYNTYVQLKNVIRNDDLCRFV